MKNNKNFKKISFAITSSILGTVGLMNESVVTHAAELQNIQQQITQQHAFYLQRSSLRFLEGYIYYDGDNDGQWDSRLGNINIELIGIDGSTYRGATNSEGYFYLEGMNRGDYELRMFVPTVDQSGMETIETVSTAVVVDRNIVNRVKVTVTKLTDDPTTEAPTTETPSTEETTTEAPTTVEPTTETPSTEETTTEAPTTAEPTTETPSTEETTTAAPTTAAPTTETPSTEETTTEAPTTVESTTELPSIVMPTTELPTMEPTTELPSIVMPTTELPTMEPTTEDPETERPMTERPTTETPETERPMTERPTTERPVVIITPAPSSELPSVSEQLPDRPSVLPPVDNNVEEHNIPNIDIDIPATDSVDINVTYHPTGTIVPDNERIVPNGDVSNSIVYVAHDENDLAGILRNPYQPLKEDNTEENRSREDELDILIGLSPIELPVNHSLVDKDHPLNRSKDNDKNNDNQKFNDDDKEDIEVAKTNNDKSTDNHHLDLQMNDFTVATVKGPLDTPDPALPTFISGLGGFNF